ncbi:hypothetical protein NLM59_01555 [Weeksellaceae bacterium KMM 9724]|uniref:hypothetical protein n=1 Tax=Profundicola chukchiensis TaxID=2961959 RepID=UPI00243E8C5C|nr:hypothetical protein [Profundicola chukchiensis]MDG4949597.1 hypothetical protein [Profundicola chukchiensis]
MKQERIKSKLNYKNIIILIIGGIVASIVSYNLTNNALSNDNPQIVGIIFGLIFGLIGAICFYSIYNLDVLILSSDKLEINTIFGDQKKIIYLNEILSFNEVEKESKYNKWKDLTIFTSNSKFKISSSNFENYDSLKNKLTSGKRRNLELELEWVRKSNRKFGIGFLIVGILFSVFFYNLYRNENKELNTEDITTIKGKIINDVEIEKGTKGKRSIEIRIEEHPEFIFTLSGNSYYASNSKNYVSKAKKGDLISLDIETEIYLKKLTEEKELELWDKIINYDIIPVYGLKDNNYKYLTLEKYNNKRKEDASWTWWFLTLICVSLIGGGIWFLWRSKTPVANNV